MANLRAIYKMGYDNCKIAVRAFNSFDRNATKTMSEWNDSFGWQLCVAPFAKKKLNSLNPRSEKKL